MSPFLKNYLINQDMQYAGSKTKLMPSHLPLSSLLTTLIHG